MMFHFIFKDGSNPYISKTLKKTWEMLTKYDVEFRNNIIFVLGRAQYLSVKTNKTDYEKNKDKLRDLAIQWQYDFDKNNYSYGELADYQAFFEYYGKRYGLLREFRENAIC